MENIDFRIDDFDINRNYIIEASAGTGKTYNVIQIVEKLVKEHNIPLSKILIVTYTEKAVGELKSRIREKLSDQDVDNASIYTIHSFCKDALNEFGLSANMPLGLQVIDEHAIDDFTERYIRQGNILKEITYLYELGIHINIKDLAKKMKDGANLYYLDRDYKEDASIISLEKEKDEDYLYKLFIDFKKADSLDDVLKADEKTNFYYGILCDSKEKLITDFASELKKSFNKDMPFSFNGSGFSKSKIKKAFDKNAKYENPYYDPKADDPEMKYVTQNDAFNFVYEIKSSKFKFQSYFVNKYLADFYKKWQLEKEKAKAETFNDMLRYVREATVHNPEFLEALKKKYTYGIIDEFQDTNQKQFDIFSSIFLEDDEHHIIVVGDPKQSIYAFQGADIEVYRKAVKKIQEKGGLFRVLNKNYRSSANMVKACNLLFQKYFTPEDFQDCGYLEDKENTKETEKGEHLMHYSPDGVTQSDVPIWILESNGENASENIKAEDGDGKKKKNTKNETQISSYGEMVAKIIIDCCSTNPDGKTKLTVKDSKTNCFRNVTFKDFTLLAKGRSEMVPFEHALKAAGIPYLRYKDQNLFTSRECTYWIAILSAIEAKDFVGKRRNIFRKCLFTPFFRRSLTQISTTHFDKDDIKEIEMINQWKILSSARHWEDLFDSIMIDTNIEKAMHSPKDMQSLSVIQQISRFCIEYLSKDHTLPELIRTLKALSENNSEDIEQNGNIIEKSTDFDCVKIMTMHASKGLQFPVVINIGGFRGPNKTKPPVIYHKEIDGGKYPVLSFDTTEKKKEEDEEIKRLFYVGNTRAQFLLILPMFDNAKQFLKESVQNLRESDQSLYEVRKAGEINDFNEYFIHAKNILKNGARKLHDVTSAKKQLSVLKKISRSDPSRRSYKHSYSSLTHDKDEEKYQDEDFIDKEGNQEEGLNTFDCNSLALSGKYDNSLSPISTPADYPKGTYIGTALHEVLEKLDFKNQDVRLASLIKRCFMKQSIPSDNLSWIDATKDIISNVMHAKLPEIHGNNSTDNFFSLCDLSSQDKKAEVEFNFNLLDRFKNYCNGFIDLMFRRGEYYSIIDWKSDSLNEDFTSYSSLKELKKHTDDSYSIQRVLYSYCLIHALRQNYPTLTEEEIFQSHFGGIYYVYIKGCNSDTSNGIYCQTWDSYESLKSAFENIIRNKVGI